MVLSGVGGFLVSLCGRAFPEYKCQVFNTKNFWTSFLTMVHEGYGKIHAGNSEDFRVWLSFITDFGILRLLFPNTDAVRS
jgi:hypothetical protein